VNDAPDGVIKITQFNGAIEFYSILTPVAVLSKWLFLNRKLAVARLCKKYGPESCTKHFFSVTTCHKHLAQ